MTGYGIYLIYSLLFWPVCYCTGRAIVGNDMENPLFRVANGFAALSALARSLGIVRWMFAMPVLAAIYVDPTSSDAAREATVAAYEMLNSYAGGVGELLGVSLFAVIWLTMTCVLILRSSEFPSWLGYFGFVTAITLFLNTLETLGVDMGPMITVSVSFLHLWMFLMGVTLLRKA